MTASTLRSPAPTLDSLVILEQPDLRCVLQMRAAAELDRLLAHLYYAYHITIFLPKQRRCAQFSRFIDACLDRRSLQIGKNHRVHFVLNRPQLIGGHGLEVREVEPQSVRIDHRSLLQRVLAENLVQRRMQQVRCRMVSRNRQPALAINLRVHLVTDAKSTPT